MNNYVELWQAFGPCQSRGQLIELLSAVSLYEEGRTKASTYRKIISTDCLHRKKKERSGLPEAAAGDGSLCLLGLAVAYRPNAHIN
jgi:hypothetical protein